MIEEAVYDYVIKDLKYGIKYLLLSLFPDRNLTSNSSPSSLKISPLKFYFSSNHFI